MEHTLKTIFLLMLLFMTGSVLGQSPAFDFAIMSKEVTYLGQEIELSSTITKTGDSLTWEQSGSGFSEAMEFTIGATSGSWDQDSSMGSVTYGMTGAGQQYELVLDGTGNDLTATLILLSGGMEQERYIFEINAIIYQ